MIVRKKIPEFVVPDLTGFEVLNHSAWTVALLYMYMYICNGSLLSLVFTSDGVGVVKTLTT